MVWQHVRFAFLAGALASTLTLSAWADDVKKDAPKEPIKEPTKEPIKEPTKVVAPPAAAVPMMADPCAPVMQKICVEEWVPEQYTCTRTVYRTECRQEAYTAYREECIPETRTRTCVVNHMVPEVKDVVRTYCVKVPVVEERTCMETRTCYKPVTKCVTKCVDRGHYECQEVPCGPSFKDRLHKRCHKDCCDSCEPCCPAPTKTVKVWVPCKVYETHEVTCMQKVCEQVPVTRCVTTCKLETRTEVCKVTCYKCVPETKVETYTVICKKCVPYQATRTVSCCVPHQETVTMTRCVKRLVEKEVAVASSCGSSCGSCESSCGSSCETECCSHHRSRRRCCK